MHFLSFTSVVASFVAVAAATASDDLRAALANLPTCAQNCFPQQQIPCGTPPLPHVPFSDSVAQNFCLDAFGTTSDSVAKEGAFLNKCTVDKCGVGAGGGADAMAALVKTCASINNNNPSVPKFRRRCLGPLPGVVPFTSSGGGASSSSSAQPDQSSTAPPPSATSSNSAATARTASSAALTSSSSTSAFSIPSTNSKGSTSDASSTCLSFTAIVMAVCAAVVAL